MLKIIPVVFLLVFGLACGAAQAATKPAAKTGDSKVIKDVRCLVIMASDISSADQSTSSQATAGYIYFLGRIEGRGSITALKQTIADQDAKLMDIKIDDERKSCLDIMAASGDAAKATLAHVVPGQ